MEGQTCQHQGCTNTGVRCTPCVNAPPDEPAPDEWFCPEHAYDAGYCYGCGGFWAGIESFDFSQTHLCENCQGDFRDYDDSEDLDL